MTNVIEVPFEGGTILFSAPRSEGGRAFGTDEVIEQAADRFEDALSLMRRIGERMVDELTTLKCQSAEVSFGLTLSAKGKFIVAEASAQASLTVKLVFKGVG